MRWWCRLSSLTSQWIDYAPHTPRINHSTAAHATHTWAHSHTENGTRAAERAHTRIAHTSATAAHADTVKQYSTDASPPPPLIAHGLAAGGKIQRHTLSPDSAEHHTTHTLHTTHTPQHLHRLFLLHCRNYLW